MKWIVSVIDCFMALRDVALLLPKVELFLRKGKIN